MPEPEREAISRASAIPSSSGSGLSTVFGGRLLSSHSLHSMSTTVRFATSPSDFGLRRSGPPPTAAPAGNRVAPTSYPSPQLTGSDSLHDFLVPAPTPRRPRVVTVRDDDGEHVSAPTRSCRMPHRAHHASAPQPRPRTNGSGPSTLFSGRLLSSQSLPSMRFATSPSDFGLRRSGPPPTAAPAGNRVAPASRPSPQLIGSDSLHDGLVPAPTPRRPCVVTLRDDDGEDVLAPTHSRRMPHRVHHASAPQPRPRTNRANVPAASQPSQVGPAPGDGRRGPSNAQRRRRQEIVQEYGRALARNGVDPRFVRALITRLNSSVSFSSSSLRVEVMIKSVF